MRQRADGRLLAAGTAGLPARVLRAGEARLGGWLRRTSYLPKWIVLGCLIGVIAGFGAVLFLLALRSATWLFLGVLGGYTPPTPFIEGGGAGSSHFARLWAIPLIVGGGGLLAGTLVRWFAPEAEGHGTDAAIQTVHTNPRSVRVRAVVVKFIASAVTIGSGGSGGREGPTAQISAGFGSLLARRLDLTPEDGRIAVSIGIGSGIGAIFGAPLGGAVLSADIVYSDDFETEALVPGLITSIIAYTVFGAIIGFSPMFGYAAPGYQFHQPIQLAWFAIIGVLAGLVGLLYNKVFYTVADLAKRTPRWAVLKPAAGGLLVGLLALAVPQVMGAGYGWVQHALDRPSLLAVPLWLVVLLPIAKIVATSLSIGSGGSGGIFGPGMVIGAFTGAAVWRVLEPIAPGVPHSPAPFVIVGMMACFGAIARAPLSMMLMVAEMTGSLTILAPAMVAVGLAYLIVRWRNVTIYRSQLRRRSDTVANRMLIGLPLLSRLRVRDVQAPPRLVLSTGTSLAQAQAELVRTGVPGAPVVDADGGFVGVLHRGASSAPPDGRVDVDPSEAAETDIAALADTTAPSVGPDAGLDQVLDSLAPGAGWVTVLSADRHVEGVVAVADLVLGYREALRRDTRRARALTAGAGVREIRVEAQSPLVGVAIAQAGLPDGVLVVSVQREDAVIAGRGSTRLRAGDLLTVLGKPDRLAETTRIIEGSAHHIGDDRAD